MARALARLYGIHVYRVSMLKLLRKASRILLELGVRKPSENMVIDVAHILAAKELGAKFFVTSDKRACKRAVRLGLNCTDYKMGEIYASS